MLNLLNDLEKELNKFVPDKVLKLSHGKLKLYWESKGDDTLQNNGFLNLIYEDLNNQLKVIEKTTIYANATDGISIWVNKNNQEIQDDRFWELGDSSSISTIWLEENGDIGLYHWGGYETILDGKTLAFKKQTFTK